MKSDKIHICLCWNDSDGNYSKFPATTILSVLENNRNNKLFFHLVVSGVSVENKNKIKSIFGEYSQEYKFYDSSTKSSEEIIKLIKENNQSRFGIGAYLRLLIPSLLPRDIDKVIYLDSDIIVNDDIKEYWEIAVDKFFVAGFNHVGHVKIKEWKLGQYINTGSMLMNLKKIRKMNMLEELKKVYNKYNDNFYFVGSNSCPDQDIINIIFDKEIKLFDDRYNYQVGKNKIDYGKIIYHYVVLFKPFRFKPCFIDKKYKELYFSYFDKTSWKGWRPAYDFKKGVMTTMFYIRFVGFLEKVGLKNLIKKALDKRMEKRI